MKKNMFLKTLLFIGFILTGSGLLLVKSHITYAAPGDPDTAVRVASVEYYEDQIIVLNNNNTKIYFAGEVDASKGNWEIINADTGIFTMIDISWLTPSTENILVIKGDKDPTQSRVIISEKPLKLEISINYSNIDNMDKTDSIAELVNIMTSVGNGIDPITFDDLEWRKGTTGQWMSTGSLTVSLLEKFMVKGTYLYFRIRAVDDVVSATYDGTPIDINQERIDGKTGGLSAIENQPEDQPTFDPTKFILVPVDPAAADPVVVYPDGTDGRRFSNEIKVKIDKKTASMVYGIDGSRFTADIKYGKEYRITAQEIDVDGKPVKVGPTDWVPVTDWAIRTLPLSTMLLNTINTIDTIGLDKKDYNGTSIPFPQMKIEIRDYATAKAASSKITEIMLDKQRTLASTLVDKGPAPDDAIAKIDKKIYISYSGNRYMVIEIPTATVTLPYEYCVVKPGDALDITRAAWISITKGTAIKILATKAVDGGVMYIRQKEIKSKAATTKTAAVGYELASTYVEVPIIYPSIPEIVDKSFTFIKGYPGQPVTFTVVLNATDKEPYETAIKDVKLGTRGILYDVTPAEANNIHTLTITLKTDSLAMLTNCTNKAITITYANGTVDKTSIKLTIMSPTPAAPLTVTSAKGTNAGTTAFTVVTSKGINNTWAYVIGDTAITGINTQDTIALITALTPVPFTTAAVDKIPVTVNQYVTVFELDSTGHIIKYKCIQITADMRL